MSKCDICKQEFGQYANLKDCGLIMCDGCCYDPSKQQLVELTSKERKLTEENRKLREFANSVANAKLQTHEVSGQYGGIDEWSFICDSYKDKAKRLLEELK